MCETCDEVRGPVAAEVVKRTGVDIRSVNLVLVALEDMAIEANEKQEQREALAKEAIRAAISGEPGSLDKFKALFGENVDVSVVSIGPDGTPAPAPAHPIDRPTDRSGDEPLPGMYL